MTRVLLTRPAGSSRALAKHLRAAGYEVLIVPTISISRNDVHRDRFAGYDWVIVTSASGVRALPDGLPPARWASVGPATATALEARGIHPELVASRGDATSLATELPDVAGNRVLLARAESATPELPILLRERGADVVEVALYKTIRGPSRQRAPLARALATGVVAVVFMSGSAIEGYLALGGDRSIPAVTAGATARRAALSAGLSVAAEAAGQTPAAITRAVMSAHATGERAR